MSDWMREVLEKSAYFMPHGHCYLWIPWLLWLHVTSDFLIGAAYVGISVILWLLVRRIRLPFSPVFIAFGLFIGLCGLTHFMEIWTVWKPDYIAEGLLKAATAAASVATAIGLVYVRPQVEEVVHAARLSEERRIRLESTNAELAAMIEKVRELDELRSQFFANVSHELRTPLALILGPAESLLQADNLTPEQRRQLETLRGNGRMLLRQVNDLLDLSKLEAGSLALQRETVDLPVWLRRVCSQFDVAAAQRGIALAVEAPDALEAAVDIDKLERIVVNLLANALKFTPEGGRVRVQLDEADGGLRLRVADSGPGIAPEHRRAVFERFRQLDGGATRRHGGTGLGLAIVQEFVALHGGTVEAGEAEEGGALFTVRLPRHAPDGGTGAAGTSAIADADRASGDAGDVTGVLHALMPTTASAPLQHLPGRAQVLLVEDNPEMRDFVAGALAAHYNVTVAGNGREGLEQARAAAPDLIVSDLMMPDMSGDQLVEALRADPAFAGVPVLLLSARADEATRVRLLAGGAQDYLTKPFATQELLARARNLIVQKQAADLLRGELATMTHELGELAQQVVARNQQLRTALEAAEAARAQAEHASLVKSHFLGMISHELRTPLSTLDMNLQLLLRDPPAGIDETSTRRLERMGRAAREMSAMIEGLLQYARAEHGTLRMEIGEVDLARVVAEVVENQRELVPTGVAVETALAAHPPLRSDARLVRTVVANLVSNALKFTREGRIVVRVGAQGEAAVVEVEDTGIGIPEADLERVFEPFEQLEPLTRKSVPGIGLGLSLVRRILESLGGAVEVESRVGVGTRFRVVLPSVDEAGVR